MRMVAGFDFIDLGDAKVSFDELSPSERLHRRARFVSPSRPTMVFSRTLVYFPFGLKAANLGTFS